MNKSFILYDYSVDALIVRLLNLSFIFV